VADEEEADVVSDPILQLEPLGLVCGGGPLRETWVDLRSRNQVFYGLNGAGKSTVLNALEGALTGNAPGGRILLELPIDEERINLLANGTGDRISEMLTGEESQIADVAHSDFVGSQAPALAASFESLMAHNDGTPMDDVKWNAFIWALAHSKHWLFTPVGTDAPRWEASPVLLVEPLTNKWAEHVAALHALADDENTYSVPSDFGLDLLWWADAPPRGAPQGVVVKSPEVV